MQREVQPRGIQRLFHSMKRAERQRGNVNQNPRTETNRTVVAPAPRVERSSFDWQHSPNLTQQDKEEIRAYGEQLRRSSDEFFARQAEISKNHPSIRVEDWLAFCEMKRREIHLDPAPNVPEQQSANKVSTPERRISIAANMYKKLNREVGDRNLVEAARILRKEVWKDDPANPQASIHRFGSMDIRINRQTREIKDRSQIGFSLSQRSGNAEIRYGEGYFENEDNFIPAARGIVSEENRRKGAKAWFIEKTHNGRKELVVIPFAYAEATKEFFDRLYNTAVDLAPSQATTQPRQLAA